ncbi:MAG: DNA polymerase III subunit beta [Patescibacteria group bacterium]|nr:DNA polymerase III subunit beta [Patescibacteria group bacterium]
MTFTIDKDIFTNLLGMASRFTSNRLSSITSLQGILLRSEKDTLNLYATNLTTFFRTSIQIPGLEKTEVVIEPKKMLEFLTFLPSGELAVEIKDKQIILKMKKTRGNFPLIIAPDFPLPPGFPHAAKPIDTDVFSKELPLVLFSASSDDTRPVLTGINFHTADGELKLVATDGFRLSVVQDKNLGTFPSMIVPADFLNEVLRYMKEAKEVKFNHFPDEKIVSFEADSHVFYSRLIEGDYPPFARVIPTEVKTTIVTNRNELQRNIKLISVFARDFSNVVVMEVSPDGLTLRPKKEGNAENTAFQEAEIDGESMAVAFNFKFVLDVLNHIEGDDVIIELLRPDAPAVFKTKKNSGFLHVIMPVRIQE